MKSSRFTLEMVFMLALLVNKCLAQDSITDFLNMHNNARAAVGVDFLTWSNTVAEYAQSYANSRIGDCALMLSQSPTYGENLFVGTNGFTIVDAVNRWIAEKADYDHASNTCAEGKVCGHYTQVVWNTSTSLGCARVTCNNGWLFINCNYYPPGNIIGSHPY